MARKSAKPGRAKQIASGDADSPLKGRAALFVVEYPKDLNATKAAERAGFSKRTARQQGARLLTNVAVARAIAEAMEQRVKRITIDADRVLEELGLIAFADLGECIRVDESGRVVILPLDKLDPRTRRAIAEISQKTTESVDSVRIGETGEPHPVTVEKVQLSIKHHSKVKALELLMAHLGMSTSKVDAKVDGQVSGEVQHMHRMTPEVARDLKLRFLGITPERLERGAAKASKAKAEAEEPPQP